MSTLSELSDRLKAVALACETVTTSVTLAGSDMRGHAADIREVLALAQAAPDLLDALRRLHLLSGQLIDEPSARIAKALATSAIYKATNTATK